MCVFLYLLFLVLSTVLELHLPRSFFFIEDTTKQTISLVCSIHSHTNTFNADQLVKYIESPEEFDTWPAPVDMPIY